MLATSEGELFGQGLFRKPYAYDQAITTLAANRQKMGWCVRCRCHDTLVRRMRAFLKKEIYRVLNRMIEARKPAEIAIKSRASEASPCQNE